MFSLGKGVLTISTDSMDLAGDLVQSLGTYLGIEVSRRGKTILGDKANKCL